MIHLRFFTLQINLEIHPLTNSTPDNVSYLLKQKNKTASCQVISHLWNSFTSPTLPLALLNSSYCSKCQTTGRGDCCGDTVNQPQELTSCQHYFLHFEGNADSFFEEKKQLFNTALQNRRDYSLWLFPSFLLNCKILSETKSLSTKPIF